MSAICPSSERSQMLTDHLIDFLNDIDGAIMKCLDSSTPGIVLVIKTMGCDGPLGISTLSYPPR